MFLSCLFKFVFLSLVLTSCFATIQDNLDSVPNALNTEQNKRLIQEAIDYARSTYPNCRPNVCYALDGSGSISNQEYALQQGFVLTSAAIFGGLYANSDFAAVQYAVLIEQISPLTNDLLPPRGFLGLVRDSEKQGSGFTFIAPGLQYCMVEFERSPQAINQIILLGDGRSNFGDNFPFGAPFLAESFLQSPNNRIVAGLVGNGNFEFFRTLVGGDASLVLRTENWGTIINILRDFVDAVCKDF